MARIFATCDDIKNASTGRSPCFRTITTRPAKRGVRLREGFAATWKIIAMAPLIGTFYQFVEFATFYPGESTIVAILVAIIPYLLIGGPTVRIARR
jgi:hypothetical protein